MLTPPSISLIKVFALIKAYILPIKSNLFDVSNESIIIKIKDTKDCSKSREKKALDHDLNIQ